jgi:hypothetical protein
VGPDQPADAVHQAGLERSLGRIFAVFMTLMVVEFWSSTATLPVQRPAGVAANLLLSVLLTGQTLQAVSRPPSQRGLGLMVVATGSLLLVSRALAVPGSPFLENNTALVMPVGPPGRCGRPVSCCRFLSWWSSWPRGPGIPAPISRPS